MGMPYPTNLTEPEPACAPIRSNVYADEEPSMSVAEQIKLADAMANGLSAETPDGEPAEEVI